MAEAEEQVVEEQETVEEQEEEVQEEEQEEQVEEKSRTAKQFDKLTESNKELKQERDKYKNVLESLVPEQPAPSGPTQRYQQPVNRAPKANQFQNLEQQDIDAQFKAMVDDDGFLDGTKLLNTLKSMDQRATRAEQEALRARKEQERQRIQDEQRQMTREAKTVHDKYPQLDPESDEFNEGFYKAVRGNLVSQMMDTGQRDFMRAADELADSFVSSSSNEEEMATKKEKEEQKEKTEQKKRINAMGTKSTSSVGYYEEEEDGKLRQQVRAGQKGALAEMLRRREEKNK